MKTLTMDKSVFMDMLEESRNQALEKEVGKMVVYTSYGHEWRPFGLPRRKRLLESVILDDGISKSVYNDVVEFMKNGKWVILTLCIILNTILFTF